MPAVGTRSTPPRKCTRNPYLPLQTVVVPNKAKDNKNSKDQAESSTVSTPNPVSAASDEKMAAGSDDKTADGVDDKSSGSNSSPPIPPDKYAALKRSLKQHKSPRSAKKQRKAKKSLPPPGDGKYNKIYTTRTADGSWIAFVMHKKNANSYGFTKPVDDQIRKNPIIKEAFGFDNIFLKVDPDNGNEYWCVEYTNRRKETRVKYATIYHRKPSNDKLENDGDKEKREAWARKCLVRFFNKYGAAKYADNDWGEEKYEYGGDLQTGKWTDYLADFITNESVASVMKEDYAFGTVPLTCDEMADNRNLVEMYFGPEKIDEGIKALRAKGSKFSSGDSDTDSDPKPYESEDDADDDEDEEHSSSKPAAAT